MSKNSAHTDVFNPKKDTGWALLAEWSEECLQIFSVIFSDVPEIEGTLDSL